MKYGKNRKFEGNATLLSRIFPDLELAITFVTSFDALRGSYRGMSRRNSQQQIIGQYEVGDFEILALPVKTLFEAPKVQA
jgi:hypothetical protein